MKFQRSTVILVGVALLLGAGVLIAESQRSTSGPTSSQTGDRSAPVLAFAETDVTALTVERNGEALRFERDAEANWQMVAPDNALAEPGAVAFLLSRLNTDSPLQTVAMAADDIEPFGLDEPQGRVQITLADGTEHRLLLGGPDFSGNANYAIIDPPDPWPPETPSDEYEVLVVTRDVANGINRPLAEWKMPVEGATDEGTANEEATNEGAAVEESPEDTTDGPEASDPANSPSLEDGTDVPPADAENVDPENAAEETN